MQVRLEVGGGRGGGTSHITPDYMGLVRSTEVSASRSGQVSLGGRLGSYWQVGVLLAGQAIHVAWVTSQEGASLSGSHSATAAPLTPCCNE